MPQGLIHAMRERLPHRVAAELPFQPVRLVGILEDAVGVRAVDRLALALALEEVRLRPMRAHDREPGRDGGPSVLMEGERAARGLALHRLPGHAHPLDHLPVLPHVLDFQTEQFGDPEARLEAEDEERLVAEGERPGKAGGDDGYLMLVEWSGPGHVLPLVVVVEVTSLKICPVGEGIKGRDNNSFNSYIAILATQPPTGYYRIRVVEIGDPGAI